MPFEVLVTCMLRWEYQSVLVSTSQYLNISIVSDRLIELLKVSNYPLVWYFYDK